MSSTRRAELAGAAGLALALIGCAESKTVATPTPVRRPGPPLRNPNTSPITPPSVGLGPEQLRPENIYVPLGRRAFVNYRGGGIASIVDGPVRTEANPAIMASLRAHPDMRVPLANNELVFSVLSHRPVRGPQDISPILAELQSISDGSYLIDYFQEMSKRGLNYSGGRDLLRQVAVYQRLREPLANYQESQPISSRYATASMSLSVAWAEGLFNMPAERLAVDRKQSLSDLQRSLVERSLPIRVVAIDGGIPAAIRSLPDLPV